MFQTEEKEPTKDISSEAIKLSDDEVTNFIDKSQSIDFDIDYLKNQFVTDNIDTEIIDMHGYQNDVLVLENEAELAALTAAKLNPPVDKTITGSAELGEFTTVEKNALFSGSGPFRNLRGALSGSKRESLLRKIHEKKLRQSERMDERVEPEMLETTTPEPATESETVTTPAKIVPNSTTNSNLALKELASALKDLLPAQPKKITISLTFEL